MNKYIKPIPPNEKFRTGTGLFPSSYTGRRYDDGMPRWFVEERSTGKFWAYRTSAEARAHVTTGEPGESCGHYGSRSDAAIMGGYEDVVWHEEPELDRYEALVAALREEAKRRNWCDDWKVFARNAGVPEELIEPKRTVRVTIEVELDAKYNITNKQHIAYALKQEPTVEFTNAVKKIEEI